MSRTLVNLCLDTVLLVITLGVIWTSCILKFVFPPATRCAGWTLWGLDYDGWANLQIGTLAVILAAVVVHVMLHWNWVCSAVATRLLHRSGKVDDGIQTLYGVSLLIGVVLVTMVLLIACGFMIRQPGHL
jgi:hypothetical protein